MRLGNHQFDADFIPRANRAAHRPVSNAIILTIIFGFLLWLCFDFRDAFISLFAVMAWVSVVFAMMRLVACFTPKTLDYGLAEISSDLPNYTLLIPLFHEAQMVPQIIRAMSAIRYAPEKLEILLITEAVDVFTTHAVRDALEGDLHPTFRQVIVPPGTPQTKPRALNYAMKSATGDLFTIYDAEDIPNPYQLLAAVKAFDARPDWTAVQAPLDYHNHTVNWLTRQFALEYAVLFHVWIPFLTRLGLPFPLGGTSNHMRRGLLDQVGGWDAHNVTEDADLSFRLAAHGGKIGYIHPPTQEEAVSIHEDWRKQRSRWLKGYLQTWDVHMARPFAPGGWRGIIRFFTLQLTLGLTLLSVLFYAPIVVGLPLIAMVAWWVGQPLEIGVTYGLTFVFSICVGCLIGCVGAVRADKPELIRSAGYMPLYWTLLFTPLMRAISEMRSRRFIWHKTRHGVSGSVDIPLPLENIAPDHDLRKRSAD